MLLEEARVAVGKDAGELRARLQEVERSRLEARRELQELRRQVHPHPHPPAGHSLCAPSLPHPFPGAEAPCVFKTKGLNCNKACYLSLVLMDGLREESSNHETLCVCVCVCVLLCTHLFT